MLGDRLNLGQLGRRKVGSVEPEIDRHKINIRATRIVGIFVKGKFRCGNTIFPCHALNCSTFDRIDIRTLCLCVLAIIERILFGCIIVFATHNCQRQRAHNRHCRL